MVSSVEVAVVEAGLFTSASVDSAFAARGLAATQAVKARDIAASLNFLLVMITLSFQIFTCYKRDINRTGPPLTDPGVYACDLGISHFWKPVNKRESA